MAYTVNVKQCNNLYNETNRNKKIYSQQAFKHQTSHNSMIYKGYDH